jgi:hypothetical protein
MISIMYKSGLALQGIVLAIGDRVMRVAIKDSGDAMEFRLINERWVSEDCEVVRIVLEDEPAPDESAIHPLLAALFPTPADLAPHVRVM